MKPFLFEAEDGNGQKRHDSIVAVNVADARFQLTRMGYRQIRILTSEMDLSNAPEIDLRDSQTAQVYAKAMTDTLPMALFRIALGNWIIWLPFVLWSAWALYQGTPFTWSDYTAFVLTAISFWVVFKLMMPSAIYNHLLEFRFRGEYQSALRLAGIGLRLVGKDSFLTKTLLQERARALAGLGKLAEANAQLEAVRAQLTEDEMSALAASMAETARDYPEALRLAALNYQRRPDNSEMAFDYATSLLHHSNKVDEAKRIIAAFHPNGLNELSRAGLNMVEALLAWHEQQWQKVVDKLNAVESILRPFMNNAMARGYLYRGLAYKANALRRLGKTAEAASLWQQISPILLRQDPKLWQRIYDHEIS